MNNINNNLQPWLLLLILVVESWLMSATEYIAIDNTLLRPGVHVDGRSGMARPDQSAGHA